MKLLVMNGSPRKGGNTDILLDKVVEGAASRGAQAEKIVLNDLDISPCQECDDQGVDGVCRIDDDMQVVFEKVKDADILVIGSPVYFGSVTAQTKMMIDRFQCIWRAKNLGRMKVFGKTRKGAFICVSATTKEDFFDNARSVVRNFFVTVDTECVGELYFPELDEKGEVLKRPDYIEQAVQLGKSLAGED